jgi:hypothetical protein
MRSTTTYLIDMRGAVVHKWKDDYPPGHSVYLLDNGHLLKCVRGSDEGPFHGGGLGGLIREFDWDGQLVWEFHYSDDKHCQHHDIGRDQQADARPDHPQAGEVAVAQVFQGIPHLQSRRADVTGALADHLAQGRIIEELVQGIERKGCRAGDRLAQELLTAQNKSFGPVAVGGLAGREGPAELSCCTAELSASTESRSS